MDDASLYFEPERAPRAELAWAAGRETCARPVVYDVTHLIARLRGRTGTGIDRIDLAFTGHFDREASRYSVGGPRVIEPAWGRRFAETAEQVWTHEAKGRAASLWAWLDAKDDRPCARIAPPSPFNANAWRRRLLAWTGHVVGAGQIPAGAIYLNVCYHRFEQSRYFDWLGARPDVTAVFMIHDLLPLDYPEYFAPGEADKFRSRISTALRWGGAFLTASHTVRRRLQAEIAARGLPDRPIWTSPFPSPLAAFPPKPAPARDPYFVVVGTIEPRKNHLLLLNLWREWAREGGKPPRLVIVGNRGWENAQILALLDRSPALSPYVAEVSDLSSADLSELIAGARALLAPSFDEGYGLPAVEALALGAPVVASDSPVAREVTQGRATLLSPLDGPSWRREIERLRTDEAYWTSQKARARKFVAPQWRPYFRDLQTFLDGL